MASRSFIVGDAGGTGTQWRVVKDGVINQFETVGFNAYTHSIEDLKMSIVETFGKEIVEDVPTYFYAAGIDTVEQSSEVTKSLNSVFGKNVTSSNDLLGVARALCGQDSGHVCILGTGANACNYDGKTVNKVGASLGYVLGDEGSGANLGKLLLKGVFRGRFDKEIIEMFQSKYDLTSHAAIQRIYNQPRPNHFLASFAPFVFDYRNHPAMHEMVKSNFITFFEAFFPESKDLTMPFHFSGSIAFYFSDILRHVGEEKGYVIKNIIQSPIAGLVLYHQTYE